MTESKDKNADFPYLWVLFKNSFSLVTLKSKFLKSEQLAATSLTMNLPNYSSHFSPSTELILLFLDIIDATLSSILVELEDEL